MGIKTKESIGILHKIDIKRCIKYLFTKKNSYTNIDPGREEVDGTRPWKDLLPSDSNTKWHSCLEAFFKIGRQISATCSF